MSESNFGFKGKDLNCIIETIAKFSEIQRATIFGSRAKGSYQKGSDTDIAVWITGNDVTPKLSGILNDETLLPYKFDVLNYDKITNADLKQQIDLYSIEIYLKK